MARTEPGFAHGGVVGGRNGGKVEEDAEAEMRKERQQWLRGKCDSGKIERPSVGTAGRIDDGRWKDVCFVDARETHGSCWKTRPIRKA
jgi:hypothetical protein